MKIPTKLEAPWYPGTDTWDITEILLPDLIDWIHAEGHDINKAFIDYHSCGSHMVSIRFTGGNP